jgi:hypothetical protein
MTVWARIKGGKRTGPQIILLCLMLAFASVQCVFACAADPCPEFARETSSDTPPCHEHKQSSNHGGSQQCGHQSLVGEYRAPVDVTPNLQGMEAVMVLPPEDMLMLSARQQYSRPDVSPPPLAPRGFSTVRRI